MDNNKKVFSKSFSGVEIYCTACGGSMYEVYSTQDGGYTHVQCDYCGHVMKLGKNKDGGRLKKPNPNNPNNAEI